MPTPYRLRGGYYDIFRRSELATELDGLEPHSDVVLDLRATQHLDCSCLGVMVAKLRDWREQKPDTNLQLLNVPARIQRLLRLLQLDHVFVVDPPDDR